VSENMKSAGKCPIVHGPHAQTAGVSAAIQHWWPNLLSLKVLHQNPPAGDPMGESFNYAEAFKTLDLDAVKKDLESLIEDLEDLNLLDKSDKKG
jgi:catalase-peroxidase